ncbi:MAG: glycosyltransferase [Actinobacteria bacterium]|nr:glycosyltransferase [Actinomycetota bacterium]
MIVLSDIAHDTRVRREASALATAGHEVVIVCRNAKGWDDAPSGVSVRAASAASPFPAASSRRLGPTGRLARWLLLPRHREAVEMTFRRSAGALVAASADFDVVHAHDLPTLPVAASVARDGGAALVYDAHECWTGRPRYGRPTPWKRYRQRTLESRLGGAARAVLTVSDGLAEWFDRTYGWRDVVVVRNTFPSVAPRPVPPPTGVVYAGRLGPGRDLPTVVSAMRRRMDLRLILVGPVDRTWLRGADLAGVDVREPILVDEVGSLYRDSGIAVVPMEDGPLNHRVALPNKLFHAIQVGVPVVAADLPEIRRVVVSHGLGALYRPGDAESFLAALHRVASDHASYVERIGAVRQEFSWEVDSRRLLDVYDRLGAS